MYKAYYSHTGKAPWKLLHDPTQAEDRNGNRPIILGGSFTQSLLDIDSFTFDLPACNSLYNTTDKTDDDYVKPYITHVKVEDIQNNVVEFEGRVISSTHSADGTTGFYESVVCEGVEAYLLDFAINTNLFLVPGSPMTYGGVNYGRVVLMDNGSFKVNPRWYYYKIMEQFNQQAMAAGEKIDKQMVVLEFLPGFEQIMNTYVYVEASYGTTCYDLLTDLRDTNYVVEGLSDEDKYDNKLETTYIHVFHEDELLYIEMDSYTNITDRVDGNLQLNTNASSVSVTKDYTDVVTEIVPWGREFSSELIYTNAAGEQLTYDLPARYSIKTYMDTYDHYFTPKIKSVLDSWDIEYVEEKKALRYKPSYKLYGAISKPLVLNDLYSETDDDVAYVSKEDALKFFQNCKRYLWMHSGNNAPNSSVTTVSVTAYDQSFVNKTRKRFAIGHRWDVHYVEDRNATHELQRIFTRTVSLDNPIAVKLEIGGQRLKESLIEKRKQKRDLVEAAEAGNPEKDIKSQTGSDNYALAGKSDSYKNTTNGGSSYPGTGDGGGTTTPSTPSESGGHRFNVNVTAPARTTAQTNGSKVPPQSMADVFFSFYLAWLYYAITTSYRVSPSFFNKDSYTEAEMRELIDAGFAAYRVVTNKGSGDTTASSWMMGDTPVVIDNILFRSALNYGRMLEGVEYGYESIGKITTSEYNMEVALVTVSMHYKVYNWSKTESTSAWPEQLIVAGHFKYDSLVRTGTNKAPAKGDLAGSIPEGGSASPNENENGFYRFKDFIKAIDAAIFDEGDLINGIPTNDYQRRTDLLKL